MRELEYRLLEAVRSDLAFLRAVGIAPCLIDGPLPEPLLVPYPPERHARLTERDAEWLKACGVAWKPEPAVQLPLDFCGRKEAVEEAWTPTEVRLRKGCSTCQGSGDCRACRGTGQR